MKHLIMALALCLLWSLQGVAKPPSLSPFDLKAIPEKEAVKTLDAKIQECQEMANYLSQLIKKGSPKANTLSQALDLFQGVVYQLINLKGEIASPAESPSITLPPLPPKPPYPLDLYENLLKAYSTIVQQLEATNRQAQLLKEEIDSLNSEIKDLTAQWLSLKKKSPPPPDYYLVLAQLISSQVRLMSERVRLSKMAQKAQALSRLQNRTDTLLNKVFSHLKLGPKDLKAAQERLGKAERALEKTRSSVRRDLTRLNRQAALLEVQRRRLNLRLGNPKLGEGEKRLLQWEKERLEVLQEKTQIARKMANQREKRALLDYTEASFQVQWLKCYMGLCSKKEKIKYLETWKEKLAKLRDTLDSTKADFNRLQTTSEIINGKVIALEQSRFSPPEKKAVQDLMETYREMLKTLNALSQLYQENMGKCKNLVLEMGYTLDLFKKRAGGMERLYTWFTENRKAISRKVKTVLYYPLWTTGQTPFTLATILTFLFIFVLGILFVRLLRRKANKILVERLALSPGTVNSLTTLIYYVLILVVLMVALSSVGINLKQVTLVLGALGVGIGFGLQTIANNFVSGIILLTERAIEAGDIVELEDGTIGEVKRISIRSTVIRTYDGLDIIVPNSELVSGRVTTWTYEDDWRRLKISFGVAYGSHPEEVARLAREAALSVASTVEDDRHAVQVWFEGFGDSSLDFTLVVWVRMHGLKSKTGLKSDYYYALYRKLTEAGIEIPFPQRDIHIRTIYPQVVEKIREGKKEAPPSSEGR